MTTIDLIGEVDDKMVLSLVKQLKGTNDKDELTVTLCTDGGCVYSALAIYDILNLNKDKYKIRIVAMGKCFSAGNIIMQAGDVREALPNTEFLIHYGFDMSTSDTEKKHNDKMDKRIRKLIGSRVTVSKRTLNSWFKQESYFSTSEAISKGLIDRVTT